MKPRPLQSLRALGIALKLCSFWLPVIPTPRHTSAHTHTHRDTHLKTTEQVSVSSFECLLQALPVLLALHCGLPQGKEPACAPALRQTKLESRNSHRPHQMQVEHGNENNNHYQHNPGDSRLLQFLLAERRGLTCLQTRSGRMSEAMNGFNSETNTEHLKPATLQNLERKGPGKTLKKACRFWQKNPKVATGVSRNSSFMVPGRDNSETRQLMTPDDSTGPMLSQQRQPPNNSNTCCIQANSHKGL